MIGAAKVAMALMARRTMVLPVFVAACVLSPAAFANAPAVLLAAFKPWAFLAVFFAAIFRLPAFALDLRLAAIFDFLAIYPSAFRDLLLGHWQVAWRVAWQVLGVQRPEAVPAPQQPAEQEPEPSSWCYSEPPGR